MTVGHESIPCVYYQLLIHCIPLFPSRRQVPAGHLRERVPGGDAIEYQERGHVGFRLLQMCGQEFARGHGWRHKIIS